ncbi:hypothetical protein OQJ19_07205 [Fluoribacter gormanii]|uniref:hypothetical protein n=1 Tax=Fluoribacter gormanii TaxID=464 RepID=UPI001040F2D3|nr:hypothetical protein [Fluoribacter gormanii]MCW8470443.1 hypothetical protein [Fluoribacter gormanii]
MALTIYTWNNSTKEYSKGLKRVIGPKFFGGNMGHTSLELTWPADEKGDSLATKYGSIEGVTISKRTEFIPEKQGDSYQPKVQVVYFAYFSWWPGYTNGHHINGFLDDRKSEWENDPEGTLEAQQIINLYGSAEQPITTKTTVKGYLTTRKEVTKIKELEHPSLQQGRLLEDDPAYQQLNSIKVNLEDEQKMLMEKRDAFMNELELAKKEGRAPDLSLDFTKEDGDRVDGLMIELKLATKQLEVCKEDFSERHRSVGKEPDGVIELPTDYDSQQPTCSLETERVLAQMVALSRSKKSYNIRSFNCSTAVHQVIESGLSDELKEKIKNDGFDVSIISKPSIASPTSVYKAGMKLKEELFRLNLQSEETEQKDAESQVLKLN